MGRSGKGGGEEKTLFLFPTCSPRLYPSKTRSYVDVNDPTGWSLKRTKGFGGVVDIGHWILQMTDLEVEAWGDSFAVIIKKYLTVIGNYPVPGPVLTT